MSEPRRGIPIGGPSAIVCRGLTKDYGQGRGLFDLDLDISRAEIFGFIGPNGAGKTTTIRLLLDLIRPTRGSAEVLGMDAHADSLAIKRRVGYLPGELPQFPGARARHVLDLLSGLRGGVDPERIRALAVRLDLELNRKYSDLSHGNKQKVGLIQAFMHAPEVLILDEPTLGLDPLIQREFWRLVDEAVSGGATVLLSSHMLTEVELGCDRIGLIREGRMVRIGSLAELRAVKVHRVEASLDETVTEGLLAGLPGVTDVEVRGDKVSCAVQGSIGPLLARLLEHSVIELDSRELSLEEVFLREFEPSA
jgi:ABC-2 type transport system ATP-binding protein